MGAMGVPRRDADRLTVASATDLGSCQGEGEALMRQTKKIARGEDDDSKSEYFEIVEPAPPPN